MEQLDELIRFQKVTVDREIRMHEVMEENIRLRKEYWKTSIFRGMVIRPSPVR